MKPGGSLPHSPEPATCPYPEPAQSSPCPPSHFFVAQQQDQNRHWRAEAELTN
jgi:hypothetical protein